MSNINFSGAFYIKLGRGGEWEADAISNGKLRLGWKQQTIDDINAGRWELIENQLRAKDQGKLIPATTSDFNALKILAQSNSDDVWVTFHQSKLWWTRLAPGPIFEDEISKYRLTAQPWSDQAANGRLLVVNELPGKLAQIQGFRATVCRVRCPDLLQRTLNGTRSPLATAISDHRKSLSQHLTAAIAELHWKDFETLVDLIFRATGWVRVSVLGQHEKAYDLLLREPITGDRYVVQVKSKAGKSDLQDTITKFSAENFRRIFFVVHSPAENLSELLTKCPKHVQVVGPNQLGELAVDAGLACWLQDKVS